MNPAFTFGYHGQDPRRLHQWVLDAGAVLCDIRFKRYSQQLGWSDGPLEALFEHNYLRVPWLGNRNYNGGPIVLDKPKIGFNIVRLQLEYTPIVLLCQCPTLATCHRAVVADRLREMSVNVSELTFPPVARPSPKAGRRSVTI